VIVAQLQDWLRARKCSFACRPDGDEFRVTLLGKDGELVSGTASTLGEAIRLAQLDYDALHYVRQVAR